ncbi:MAG: FAD-dependent oxidoreductase [Firmicutes bacterium]|nr:FAD-dependent oxidoreductase [Bacillota bacterium]
MNFERLFEPGEIGTCWVKNRIIMAPMGNINMADPIGRPLTKMIDYFAERARGGAGLLITGLIPISHGIDPTVSEDNDTTYFPRIDGSSRTRLSGWRDLAAAVHSFDAKIFIQLTAGLGRVGSPEVALKGKILKSASVNRNFYVPQLPHIPFTDRQIKKIIKNTGQGAVNAMVSGFDGVQLHGHEGYLMDQLTSLPWNRRKLGRYRNRFQFGIDSVKEIKRLCGKDFPVIYRMDLTQALQHSYGDRIFKRNFRGKERVISEGLAFCKALWEAGVDAFDVDKGCYDNWFYPHPPAYFVDKPYVDEIALALKEFFVRENIPAKVIAVGKMGKPEVAESVLAENKADFVMLGRPLLADPYWPQKVREGRTREIIHCIGDQEGCIQSFILGGHPCCTVNPYAGFEDTKKLVKTNLRKRVAVVGAGPGGCEAARTAFLRGHDVTLFEKESYVGGQLYLSGKLKIKHDVARYIENLQYQMEQYSREGLEIRYQTEAGVEMLQDFDVVICSTGLKPLIPPLEGLEKTAYREARELLKDGFALPEQARRVTVVGGGLVGCEVAYSLAYEKGLEVTVVEMLPELMEGVVHANRGMMLWLMMGAGAPTDRHEDRLKNPVKVYNASKVFRISENKVHIRANRRRPDPYTPWTTLIPRNVHNPFARKLNPDDTEEIIIDTDFIIFSTGGQSEKTLYENLIRNADSREIYCIGDAREPARAWEAITEANDVARHI